MASLTQSGPFAGAQQQQPHLEECKTDSSKTDKLDSAGSEGGKSSGLPPQRAQPYTHTRSFSGGSNQGGVLPGPSLKFRRFSNPIIAAGCASLRECHSCIVRCKEQADVCAQRTLL